MERRKGMSEEVIELPKLTLIEDLGKIYATENKKEKRRIGFGNNNQRRI